MPSKPSSNRSLHAPKSVNQKKTPSWVKQFVIFGIIGAGVVYFIGFSNFLSVDYSRADYQAQQSASSTANGTSASTTPSVQPLDIASYNAKVQAIANNPVPKVSSTTGSTTPTHYLWPTKGDSVYPEAGALLPFHRIVAYYGNFYSTSMGVLGEYPTSTMIPMLMSAVKQWQEADPSTPVIPGIDYIAVTAQGHPGPDGLYNLRMPADQIQKAIDLANQVNGVVILDIQVGQSSVEKEVPLLAPYLKLPNVELALDPEFAMHGGAVPGTVIGSLDASDINWAANYLAGIVDTNHLTPKILIVHRFTPDMVTRYQDITPLPQVQIVMDMDGWGSQAKKINTYTQVIHNDPVQFTGFKLFYKNDLRPPSTGMLTPAQVLKLSPQPLFIQYQ
jgi:hypothetical protein